MTDPGPSPFHEAAAAGAEVVPLAHAHRPDPDSRPRKSRPAAISPHASAGMLLAANLMRASEDLSWNGSLALSGSDPESIHQLRVALRRVRAIFSLARDLAPAERLKHLRDLARAVNRALGPAREADVFISDLLDPVRDAIPNNADLAQLGAAAEAQCARRWDAARAEIAGPDFGHLLDGLRALARDLRDGEHARSIPAADFARHALRRRHKKLSKAGKHLKHMSAAERHRLRIAAKKQRYAAEIMAGVFPGKASRRYARALAKVQSALGIMNDIAGLGGELDALVVASGHDAGAARAAGLVAGYHAANRPSRDRALTKAWRRLKSTHRFWRAA